MTDPTPALRIDESDDAESSRGLTRFGTLRADKFAKIEDSSVSIRKITY